MIKEIYEIFKSNPKVTTDSRQITKGAIFFALKGESFDGNRYAIRALEGGATAAVVDDKEVLRECGAERFEGQIFVVEDALEALQQLARKHRQELGIEILAITGSNGKTTTKELVSAVLSKRFNLYATRGNLNNHIGVPLTILSMDRSTEFGIVEMGASSCGEIALLCSIAEPNWGIVTNIGRAHLDGFGGVEGVKRGKGELMDYLQKSGGKLFLATDNEILTEMAEQRDGLGKVEFSYELASGVKHHLEGAYNSYNIAAAVAIGRYFEVEQSDILEAIESYNPTNNRSQRVESERNTLIVDCYNANPSSMEVALHNFVEEEFLGREGKVLILGDMRELGEWSSEEHQKVIDQAVASSVESICLVGEEFRKACELLQNSDQRVELFENREELIDRLNREPISECAILVKGSHGVGLEKILISL